jgi:hypothetical protein
MVYELVKKLPAFLWNPEVYYRVHKILSGLFYDNHKEAMLLLWCKEYGRSNYILLL